MAIIPHTANEEAALAVFSDTITFEPIQISTILRCGHTFEQAALPRSLAAAGGNCPLCMQPPGPFRARNFALEAALGPVTATITAAVATRGLLSQAKQKLINYKKRAKIQQEAQQKALKKAKELAVRTATQNHKIIAQLRASQTTQPLKSLEAIIKDPTTRPSFRAEATYQLGVTLLQQGSPESRARAAFSLTQVIKNEAAPIELRREACVQLLTLLKKTDSNVDLSAELTAFSDWIEQSAPENLKPWTYLTLGFGYSYTKKPEDVARAVDLFRKLANSDQPDIALEAHQELGELCPEEAALHWQSIVDSEQAPGSAKAMALFSLAVCYFEGSGGVVQSKENTLRYFTLAKDHLDSTEQLRIISIFRLLQMSTSPEDQLKYSRALLASKIASPVQLFCANFAMADLYEKGCEGLPPSSMRRKQHQEKVLEIYANNPTLQPDLVGKVCSDLDLDPRDREIIANLERIKSNYPQTPASVVTEILNLLVFKLPGNREDKVAKILEDPHTSEVEKLILGVRIASEVICTRYLALDLRKDHARRLLAIHQQNVDLVPNHILSFAKTTLATENTNKEEAIHYCLEALELALDRLAPHFTCVPHFLLAGLLPKEDPSIEEHLLAVLHPEFNCPERGRAQLRLGNLYRNRHQLDKAAHHFRAAMQDPESEQQVSRTARFGLEQIEREAARG